MKTLRWATLGVLILAGLGLLMACEPKTAAQYAAADGTLAATAQMDQYRRDAAATGTARAIQFEADVLSVQSTAFVATATAGALAAAETAQASVNATATARVEAQMTETAQALATAEVQASRAAATNTAIAEAQLTQAAQARATETQQAEQHATATAAVVETQTAILLETQAAEAQRQRIENAAITILVIIGTCVVIYLIFILVRTYNRNTAKAGSIIAYGPHGNPLILADNGKSQTIINPLINTSAITTLNGQGQVLANELPELMRAQAMLGALAVLYQQAQHSPFKPVPSLPEKSERWKVGGLERETRTGALPASFTAAQLAGPHQPTIETAQAAEQTAQLPLPAWSVFTRFDWTRRELLIGIGPNGAPLTLNPENDPHILVAGTSGSGKTRHGLVVLAAGGLRLDWHVVVLNRAGADFGALTGHPAMHVFDAPGDPLRCLAATASEVDRRNVILREANVSTWSRLPGAEPRVLVIVDELVALTQAAAQREEGLAIWRAVVHIASAGRKCGLHLAFATTDPTHKTLGRFGLVARDNCARIAFRLRSSQAVLPGEALALTPRRFLALTSAGNAPLAGAAFAPTDDELTAWVSNLPSAAAGKEPLAFIAGGAPAIAEPQRVDPPELEQVRAALLAEPGISKRRLSELVFGKPYAGCYVGRLDGLLSLARAQAATTTATSPEIGQ